MNVMENPIDLLISVNEFMQLLKDQGMVIGPRTVFEKKLVKGIPFDEYRRRVLQKNLISFGEICNAKLWGDVGRKRVYSLAMELIPETDQVKLKGVIKIPREVVLSVAASRGVDV